MRYGENGGGRLPSVRTLQHLGQLLLAIAGLVVAAQSLIDSLRKPESPEPEEAGPHVVNHAGE